MIKYNLILNNKEILFRYNETSNPTIIIIFRSIFLDQFQKLPNLNDSSFVSALLLGLIWNHLIAFQ